MTETTDQSLTKPDGKGTTPGWLRGIYAGLFLYLFLCSINVMGGGLKMLMNAESSQVWIERVFDLADNPFVALMAGVFLGGLTTLTTESGSTDKLGKGFGLIAGIYGAIMLLGSLSGGQSPLQPLAGINVGGTSTRLAQHELEFQRIKSVEDLDRALVDASSQGKTAMLDFYADWCVSCKEMEAYTFTDDGVQQTLSNTVLLQADVTANDELDQELLQRFGVFGPPTIIFFGTDGLQRNGYEVVGYMQADAFSAHVKQAFGTTATITAQAETII